LLPAGSSRIEPGAVPSDDVTLAWATFSERRSRLASHGATVAFTSSREILTRRPQGTSLPVRSGRRRATTGREAKASTWWACDDLSQDRQASRVGVRTQASLAARARFDISKTNASGLCQRAMPFAANRSGEAHS
jgi:uncharacterized protein YfiM (DUF2279 family)